MRGLMVALGVAVLAAGLAAPAEAQRQGTRTLVAPLTPAQAPQIQSPVSFSTSLAAPAGTLVVPLGPRDELSAVAGTALPADVVAAISRAMTSARFKTDTRGALPLRGIGAWDQILVIATGAAPNPADIQRTGAIIGRRLMNEPGAVSVFVPHYDGPGAAILATGIGLGEYRGDLYRTRDRTTSARGPTTVVIAPSAMAEAQADYRGRGRALIEAMAWTRDVSNAPANVIYPETFVASAREAFRGIPGVTITVLDEREMTRLGMGALLGVGQGSARPPRLLAVRYRGANAPYDRPLVLVGKGITFDSGGISIKAAAGMHNMRMDMSGAASITGAVLALARAGAQVDVVAVSALAENMPDGNAIRPGDVLTAMNGMTIEVLNTDAEGRLVLADAIVWAQRTLNPGAIVDVATLTGSVRTALGDDYAGLFSRNSGLAQRLITAGEISGDALFQLPLHDSYATDLESPLADLRNVAGEGTPGAGIGAHFIGAFVEEGMLWAHIDIANVAWSGPTDWKPDGSAGFGVRLLEQFARDWRGVPPAEAAP